MIKSEKQYDVIVIGGGASGLMAALIAARRGKKVLILEKNKSVGKKLSISGGGRCNITNNTPNVRAFLANYGSKSKQLFSAFTKFGAVESIEFFEKNGMILKTEERGRMFPISDNANDVVLFFVRELKKLNVEILCNASVKNICLNKGLVEKIITDKNEFKANSYVCSVGGLSHPETGSTGDGFAWLSILGHTIMSPSPSIVPLRTREKWSHELSGVSMNECKITFSQRGKKILSKKGRLLFTHFGLSGPMVLNASPMLIPFLKSGHLDITINIHPECDSFLMDKKIVNTFETSKNKMFKNVLPLICKPGMIDGISLLFKKELLEKQVNAITKEERKEIGTMLQNLPVTATGVMGYDWAVVADGGVPLSEINTRKFASNIIPNLYITGDMLDITRPSGGFSLQLCWTSGYIAGENV